MTQEIKFRGKRLDTGEWIYGSYVYEPYGPNTISDWNNVTYSRYEVDEHTVGQLIGRCRGSSDIYVGDWVRTDYNLAAGFSQKPVHTGVVEYSSLYACYGIRNGVLFQPISELTVNKWKIEPIGNVHDHDHPELPELK